MTTAVEIVLFDGWDELDALAPCERVADEMEIARGRVHLGPGAPQRAEHLGREAGRQ